MELPSYSPEPAPEPAPDVAVDWVSLQIQRLDRELPLPEYARPGDAGLDLCSRVNVLLAAGDRGAVPTGVAIAIPPGHAGLVLPRSGLALRHGVTVVNSPGLVDSGYRGELIVALVNLGDDPYEIRRGDRIAQLVVVPFAAANVIVVDELPASPGGAYARHIGGFGHSGA